MASASLFCLTFTLIISCYISLATVDIFQSQDRSACHGMMADVTCITVVAGGLLRLSTDGGQVLSVNSGQTASFSETSNGSLFVFVEGQEIDTSGVNVYESTASLNTNITRSITCSDGLMQVDREVVFVVQTFVGDVTQNNDNYPASVTISWRPPVHDAICCVEYYLETSNGNINTTETSFTMSNVNGNSFAVIHCMDMSGTIGPGIMHRVVAPPSPSSTSSPTTTMTATVCPSTTPCPPCPCRCYLACIPWWIWLVICILIALAFLLAVYAVVITTLYLKEKNKTKPQDVISVNLPIGMNVDTKEENDKLCSTKEEKEL